MLQTFLTVLFKSEPQCVKLQVCSSFCIVVMGIELRQQEGPPHGDGRRGAIGEFSVKRV